MQYIECTTLNVFEAKFISCHLKALASECLSPVLKRSFINNFISSLFISSIIFLKSLMSITFVTIASFFLGIFIPLKILFLISFSFKAIRNNLRCNTKNLLIVEPL